MNVQQALAAILADEPDCDYATVECRVVYSNFISQTDPKIELQYYVYTELRGAHAASTLAQAVDSWRGASHPPDATIPRRFDAFEKEAKTLARP